MAKAYEAWQKGQSVYKAAFLYGVPEQTLRDRTKGYIKPEKRSSGPDTILSPTEEKSLCDHVREMALYGYGYSNSELRELATDTAIYLGKWNDKEKLLGRKWLKGFLRRWPDMKALKPRSLSMIRAKAVSREVIENYYNNLEQILNKYELSDKPHRIFNIDETGISPEHSPPSIIGPRGTTVPAITSVRFGTTTVISSCNATGQSVPPFFVFKGKRASEDLLSGALPGTGSTMSATGWSNSLIFHEYIETHLSKHIPGGIGTDYTLLIYDGATSHISVPLIEWAKENKVILFVLPAHGSHLLQPLDVGVFKPFKTAYNKECQAFMRTNVGRQITRYDICNLVCKAYPKALTPSNIISSFRKIGIWPLNRDVVPDEKLAPNRITTTVTAEEDDQSEEVTAISQPKSKEMPNPAEQNRKQMKTPSTEVFLKSKVPKFVPPFKKPRSAPITVAGQAITETELSETLVSQAKNRKSPCQSNKTKAKTKSKVSKCSSKISKSKSFNPPVQIKSTNQCPSYINSQEPGPSHINLAAEESEPMSDDETPESDLCCMCKLWQPRSLRQCQQVQFVSWAQCDKCAHWTHVKYCSPVQEVNDGDSFLCPHCSC